MISWNSAPPMHPLANAANSVFGTHIVLDRAAEITPEAIKWLWDGHLAVGKWHLIAGSPGTGKSGIALALAACVSNGSSPLPDGTAAPRGHVVILATEDGVADTIVPRLIAAGADMDYIHIVRGTSDRGRMRQLGTEDYERLNTKLEQIPGVRLLILDPVTQMVKKNGNSNIEVRKALEPLTELAEKHGFAILGIAHLAKGSQKRAPLERVAGSLAFGALCRVVMLTVRGENDDSEAEASTPAPCALVRIKSNIGPDGGGFSYTVRPAQFGLGLQQFRTSVVAWEGRLTGTAKAIIESIEGTDSGSRSSALTLAKEFLVDQLQGGPQPSTLVQQRAAEAKISMGTLRRAREDLGVVVEKLRNGEQASPWMWSLPGTTWPGPAFGSGPVPPMGPMFSTGRFGPGPFNPGSSSGAALFHSPRFTGMDQRVPMFTPHHGFPAPGYSAGGHVEHVERHVQVAHHDQVARHEQVEQLEQVEHNGDGEEPLFTVVTHDHDDEADQDEIEDDADTLLAFNPQVDPVLLTALIEECCANRDRLPELLKDDDDTLEGIEQSALAKLAPADRFLYRTALNQSDWMFY